MRNIVLFASFIVTSCVSPSAGLSAQPSWCADGRVSGAGAVVEIDNARFYRLNGEHHEQAIQALSDDSVLSLSRAEAARLTGRDDMGDHSTYYLVRAAEFAPIGTENPTAADAIPNPTYHLWAGRNAFAVVVLAQPAFGTASRAQNVPMVLGTSIEITRASLVCYWIP